MGTDYIGVIGYRSKHKMSRSQKSRQPAVCWTGKYSETEGMQIPKVESPEWVVDNMEVPTVGDITGVETGKL